MLGLPTRRAGPAPSRFRVVGSLKLGVTTTGERPRRGFSRDQRTLSAMGSSVLPLQRHFQRRAAAMRKHAPSLAGFTLIELIVLTAIMALLATILFPLFHGARSRAYPSPCTANLRQYSAAFRLYLQDYDETFPLAMSHEPYRRGEFNVMSWDLLLQAYLKNADAGRCPNDPWPAFFEFQDGTRVWRSYATPRNLIWIRDRNNPRDPHYPMRLARVTRPDGTVLLLEKNQGVAVNGSPYPGTRQPRCWPCAGTFENYQQCAWERHGERLPALFVEGHVRVLQKRGQGVRPVPSGPAKNRFLWPHLEGYSFRPGAGADFDRNANGDQFWEFCPIPGEEPNGNCPP